MKSIVPISAAATFVVGLGIAGAVAAQAEAPATVVPSTASTQVVAGSLSHANFQQSLLQAYDAKLAADAQAAAELQSAADAQAAAAAQAATAAAATQTGASTAASTSSAPSASSATTSSSAGAASGDAASWASSSKAMSVKQCESGNNYSTNTGNGYYGAWQFDIPSWLANGGGAYAPTPDQAPSWAQDQVAYNYYSSAGWGPWSCG